MRHHLTLILATLAPTTVTSALEARGRFMRLESVTAQGKTHFEGRVRTKAGKTVAIELDSNGKPIK